VIGILSGSELLVRLAHGVRAVKALQAPDGEVTARHVLVVADEDGIHEPAAPRIGSACAAAFSETTIPKREAMSDTSRTSAGAPPFASPFCARCFEASVTAVARAERTAK